MNLLDGADQAPDLRLELEAKWKDKPQEELLKAKVESDLYIKTLEGRLDEIRTDFVKQSEDLQVRANLQDLVDQLNQKNLSNSDTPPAKDIKESPTFDLKQIESLVSTKIAQTEQAKKETENFNMVKAKLVEKLGQNYQTSLNEQLDTLGLSPEDLNQMARTRPNVLIKALGLDETTRPEGFQAPPRSGQRQDNFAPKGQTKRNWNYYQELKKSQPLMYLDRKIAVQMHNDAVEQGESFYS